VQLFLETKDQNGLFDGTIRVLSKHRGVESGQVVVLSTNVREWRQFQSLATANAAQTP
jgi:hypothetical protein